MSDAECSRFGDFVLDFQRHLLLRDGQEVALPSRAVAVLEALVRAAPEVVDKTALLDAGWPDVAVVEDNLVQAIGALRSALGDDSREPRFVQTVHRRGYRFIGELRSLEDDETPVAPSASAARRRWPWLVVGAAVAVVAVGVLGLVARRQPAARPVDSLVVLPMSDLTEGRGDDLFADGMTDALITELARYPGLDVISRTSAMRYRTTDKSVPQIADEVGVDAVIEGTVTRADGRVRVIAQLVDADDHHLWGESFERPLEDVLDLQRDMAEAIAAEVGARLRLQPSAPAPSLPRVQPEAHTAYLRGRHVLEERTESSLERAITEFEKASALEPDWAEPWLGLADALNLMANYGYRRSTEARPEAREAAVRALELDPNLGEAHTALGLVEAEYEWDFVAAEQSFQRALALNPSSATGHAWYAHFLVSQNRLDAALREMRRANRLDPLSPIIEANIGWLHLYAGQLEVAEECLRTTLGHEPGFAVAHYYLGILLAVQGRDDEARTELARAIEISGGADYARAALGFAAGRAGDLATARAIRDRLLKDAHRRYVSPVSLTFIAAGMGDHDAAFAHLQQAFDERKGWLLHIRYDPMLRSLHGDPRFERLARAIGLPD